MGLVVPLETAAVNDCALEGEKGMECLGVDGVAGREGTGHVSARALVG